MTFPNLEPLGFETTQPLYFVNELETTQPLNLLTFYLMSSRLQSLYISLQIYIEAIAVGGCPRLLFQLLSHFVLSLFPQSLLVPMDHDCPSPEPVVFHSRKPDDVAGENEDSSITNESHGLCDGQPETMDQQPNDRHNSQAELVSVPKRLHLGYFSTVWVKMTHCLSNLLQPLLLFASLITNASISNLCLNKIVGTGIFISPSVVLRATESKGISLMLWLVGCLVTWGG